MSKTDDNKIIEEYDRIAPIIYGNILNQVPQEPIANNIFEKVMVEVLAEDLPQNESLQSPIITILNKARKKSKKTIDSLNLFRECSGGIDSTVAALLLHEQGYEVVGVTMKTWDYANVGGSKKETGCCSLDSINDAREVAVDNGFHHFIIDIREEFGDYVIDNFVDEYMAGS